MIVENIIGYSISGEGTEVLKATSPLSLKELDGDFKIATEQEVNRTLQKAKQAFLTYSKLAGARKAEFLEAIATQIINLGDELVKRACAESGLPEQRIIGERGRTVNQLRLFAKLVREGSWINASIDKAQPDRQPLPKADIRKMLIPVGPVVVFAASNFPLAFSTAGGDTASALAAGNPVIVKAHNSHLGTNALVASAIQQAAKETNMPDGVFSSLIGRGYKLGKQLVQHPEVRSVGFTGSFAGGKALFDLANQRPQPIPVFAEMSSINPVILLPNKLAENHKELANSFAQSITLGAGQFCTNPGLLIGLEGAGLDKFSQELGEKIASIAGTTMLNKGIWESFEQGKDQVLNQQGVNVVGESNKNGVSLSGKPIVANVSAADFIQNPNLRHEVFGPYSLLVKCKDKAEVLEVMNCLDGQLAATIIGNEVDLEEAEALVEIAKEKAGRVLFNGVPTGVEVCDSMVHGGPFPATSDSRFTSVGTDAIKRFARPICLQNTPQVFLPDELKDENPLGIWRKIDGEMTKKAID